MIKSIYLAFAITGASCSGVVIALMITNALDAIKRTIAIKKREKRGRNVDGCN